VDALVVHDLRGMVAATDGGDGAPEASPATTPGGAPGRLEPGIPHDQCRVIVDMTIAMADTTGRPGLSMLTRLEGVARCMKCGHLEKCYPHNNMLSVSGGRKGTDDHK
jgi:hypothetical protein